MTFTKNFNAKNFNAIRFLDHDGKCFSKLYTVVHFFVFCFFL